MGSKKKKSAVRTHGLVIFSPSPLLGVSLELMGIGSVSWTKEVMYIGVNSCVCFCSCLCGSAHGSGCVVDGGSVERDQPDWRDEKLVKIKVSVLASCSTLTNFWSHLSQQGFTGTSQELSPASDVIINK